MPYRKNSIHLWTQTPAGGLPPPKYKVVDKKLEEKPAGEKKDEMAKVVGTKRKARYWKRFYRANPQLVRGAWDAELWSAFSGLQEDPEEPKRSKFFRKQFRQNPEIYTGKASYASDSDTDSDFDSDMSSDSDDSDSDDDRISSRPSNRRFSFNRRQAAIARVERDEHARRSLKQKYLETCPESEDAGWNSDSDSDSDDDDKHVHWSDEEGKIKPILKQIKNAQKPNVIVKKPGPLQIQEDSSQQPVFVEFTNCYQKSPPLLSALNVFVQHTEQSPRAERTVVEVDRRRAAPQSSTPGDSRISNPRDNHNSQLSRLRSPPSNFNTPLSPPQSPLNFNSYSQSDYYRPNTSDYYIYCKRSRSFYPVGQGVLCDFWPALGLYLPRTMETTNSRAVLPVEAKVLVVEHVVELPSDPRPNAFYDAGSNTLRVYHGNVYGNPNGMSIPVRTETIYHPNPLIGAGGGFGAIGAPIGPFTMGARPGLLQGPFGLVSPAADAPYVNAFSPGASPYADVSLPPDLERRKRDAEYAAVLQACRRAEYGRYMDNYIAQGKLRESMHQDQNQNQNQNNNHNGGGNSNNWNGNGNGNDAGNQNNNRNFSGQSANRKQNQNGNSRNGNCRNSPQQSGNCNQSQGNRPNSGNKSNNGQNQSRSNSGNQNFNSNSGGRDAWGNGNWDNDNSNNNSGGGGQDAYWNDSSNDNSNNNNADSWSDDKNGMSSDPAPACPPSPTVTVIHHDNSVPFSSEINVRIVVDADEAVNVTVVNDDGSRIPTETRAYMPCTFPGSPSQNSAYDSGYGNSNDNYNSNTDEAVDEWGNVISGDNNNSNDKNDQWGNDQADAWGESAGDKTPSPPRNFGNNGTQLSAGSWASKNNTPAHTSNPASRKENRNNNSGSRNNSNLNNNGNSWNNNQKSNGYNLKQTNGNQNNDTWGDPTAAQSTGRNLSGGW